MTENDNVVEFDFQPPADGQVEEMNGMDWLREQLQKAQGLNCLLGLALLAGRGNVNVLVEAVDGAHIEIETTNPTQSGKVLVEVRRDLHAEAATAQEGLSVKANASV